MFQALLTAYYLCDVAAAGSLMDYGTVIRCSLTYELVKEQFLTEEERAALEADTGRLRAAYGPIAYRRFTEWERQNAPIVAEMKADAAARIAAGQAGL